MKRIYLIDASSFIYRMFYGVPEMMTKKGEYVNAVFGIARFFLVQMKYENPDYLIFIKDAKGKNFRHDLDKNYKATRDKMPDNLRSQMPIIYDMVEKMGIPIIEKQGYEADDIIGTLANKYNGVVDCEVDILSGDKDLYSLVSKNVVIYDTMKKKRFGIEETIEKFGVSPDKIIDYLAIVGDKADNIPGIDGFGPKKAVTLLNEFGSIEKIYEILDSGNFENLSDESKKIFKGKNLEKLENSRENAFLSKKLATIELNVDLSNISPLDKGENKRGFNLEDFKFLPENYLTPEVKELFRELEFNSLLGEEPPRLKKWEDLGLKVKIIDNDEKLEKLFNLINSNNYPISESFPLSLREEGTITNKIVLDTETTSLDIMRAKLVGISIYINDDKIYYINRLHKGDRVSDKKLKDFLQNLFNLDVLIIGHNIKYDLEIIDLFLKNDNILDEDIREKQISLF